VPRSNDTKNKFATKIKLREAFDHHYYLFIQIFHLTISINKQSWTMAPATNESKAKGKVPDQAPAKFKLKLNVNKVSDEEFQGSFWLS
jgi:hypothetical protein